MRELQGMPLERVCYRLVPFSSEIERSTETIDVVDIGVELIFGDTQIDLLWVTDGSDGHIGIYAGPVDSGLAASERVDASGDIRWLHRLQRQVKKIGVAFYSSDLDLGDWVWSIRLEFAEAAPVVIALGEVIDDKPVYTPDTLLVIFDELEARGYFIDESLDAAWGIDI
jgi:hypothetical protein